MTNAMRWSRIPAGASVVLLSLVLMGAEKGGCGPIDPPVTTGDQCAAAADCVGLPHVMCLGDWACDTGACKWQCDLPDVACTQDSQCAKGEVCTFVTECPACTTAVPPCMAPCTSVGHCATATTTECVVGGCSGQLCGAKGDDLVSDCMYAEWYGCLQFSTCGNFGTNGACGWEVTPAFTSCMAGLSCGADSACAPGYVCQNGTCVLPEQPVGCFSDSDCGEGTHCSISDGVCASDPTCPMCDVCYGQCVPDVTPVACTADIDCKEGYICQQTAVCPPCVYESGCKVACQMVGQCVPKPVEFCTSDAECLTGQYCRIDACPADANCGPDASGAMNCVCTGSCQPVVTPGTCQTDADCQAGERCYWTGGCPPCDCASGTPDCACPMCMPPLNGQCGPYCDPAQAETCWNGIDDNCDGQVDEGCTPATPCTSDADCAQYEYCSLEVPVYDAAGNLSCCPANARCTPDIPSCVAGQCRLQAGYCWTDGDCGYGEQCLGASRCPPGAMCFVADYPGKCSPAEQLPCQSSADCPADQVCQWINGCPICECASEDPTCTCPMCAPAANGWCVPAGCVDRDGDGFCGTQDCDDANSAVFPGAAEPCDGIDNDCDGQVDEACQAQCFSDADCGAYETCQLLYAAGGASPVACCPPNAFCDSTMPPCGGGTCVLQSGLCWSDTDCGYGQKCEGAIVCPPGAMCFVADQPGKCVDAGLKCIADTDCTAGEFCDMTRNPISACCLPDQVCLMYLPVCQGLCSLQDGRCWTDADCVNGGACEGARKCPPGALCILPDAAGTCSTPTTPAKCSMDSDCATGQACRLITVCPACAGNIPPCAMPCSVEGQCMNECVSNADCGVSQYCEITKCDPATGTKCLGPYYCRPYGLD